MKRTLPLCLLALTTACSLSPPDQAQVTLSLSGDFDATSGHKKNQLYATDPSPASVVGFDCIAFNVMGLGIPSTSADNGCDALTTDERVARLLIPQQNFMYTYPGVTSLPVRTSTLTAGGETLVTLSVPSGRNRIFQAVGIVDNGTGICDSTTPVGNVDLDGAYFYDLGRTTLAEIAGGSGLSVAIPNEYKDEDMKLDRKIEGCSVASTTSTTSTSSTSVLTSLILQDISSISGDDCTLIQGSYLNQNGQSMALPEARAITLTVSGVSGQFYAHTDSTCSGVSLGTSISGSMTAASNAFQYRFKPTTGGTVAVFSVSSPGLTGDSMSSVYNFSTCASGSSITNYTNTIDLSEMFSGNIYAQRFSLATAKRISSMKFKISVSGGGTSPTTLGLQYRLWSHDSTNNNPDTEISNTGCDLTPSVTVPQSATDLTCTFGTPYDAPAGVYWVALQPQTLPGGSVHVNFHGSDNASDGTISSSEYFVGSSDGGTSWSTTTVPGGFGVSNPTLPGKMYFEVSGCSF